MKASQHQGHGRGTATSIRTFCATADFLLIGEGGAAESPLASMWYFDEFTVS